METYTIQEVLDIFEKLTLEDQETAIEKMKDIHNENRNKESLNYDDMKDNSDK